MIAKEQEDLKATAARLAEQRPTVDREAKRLTEAFKANDKRMDAAAVAVQVGLQLGLVGERAAAEARAAQAESRRLDQQVEILKRMAGVVQGSAREQADRVQRLRRRVDTFNELVQKM